MASPLNSHPPKEPQGNSGMDRRSFLLTIGSAFALGAVLIRKGINDVLQPSTYEKARTEVESALNEGFLISGEKEFHLGGCTVGINEVLQNRASIIDNCTARYVGCNMGVHADHAELSEEQRTSHLALEEILKESIREVILEWRASQLHPNREIPQ